MPAETVKLAHRYSHSQGAFAYAHCGAKTNYEASRKEAGLPECEVCKARQTEVAAAIDTRNEGT